MGRLIVFSILFLVVFMPNILAESFDLYVDERGKVTSFYDEYYIARVNGTLTITNPSQADFFNINIPLYLSTYTLRSVNNSDNNYIDETGIHILKISGNSSIIFDYEIGGISTEKFTENGNSMLETAISAFNLKIYSNILGSLRKAPFENALLTGNNNTRLISVHLTNPTGFEFNVDFVHVIKTVLNDPSVELNSWDFTSELSVLTPYESIEFDFFDEDAHEGEIYWLQTDIYLDEIDLFVIENISFFNQDDLYIPETNGTNITYNETSSEFFEKRVFIRKLISSNLALPGELMNVSIIVNNFGTTSLAGVLTDSFPSGFELKQVYASGAVISDNSLVWDIDITPRTAKQFIYELEFVDENSVGVDYFSSATIQYGDEFIYSQAVPFVRRYVADKKVYMQKSLDFRPNGDVEVEITVRNLGESSLTNLIVKEYLGPGNEFKEITKPFREKGIWHIEKLRSGEIWETSYVTDKSTVLNTFPELFGVSRSSLFRNIILKNVIESKFKILETSVVEILGISLLVLVIIAYILPHSLILSLKRNFVKDLKMTDRELISLKDLSSKRTAFHSTEKILSSKPVSSQQAVSSYPSSLQHSEYLTARQEKIDRTQVILDKIKKRIDDEEN